MLETSGAVSNYPVDQECRMLLNQGVYFRLKSEQPLDTLPSQLSVSRSSICNTRIVLILSHVLNKRHRRLVRINVLYLGGPGF